MRTITIFAILALFAIANAGKLTSSNQNQKTLNSEAHFQAMKETPFGANLMNMISLKFKATGKLDDLIELLETLEANIVGQQQDDDTSFDSTSSAYKDTIIAQNQIIEECTDNIKRWTEEIAADTDLRAQDTVAVDNLNREIDSITTFLAQLKDQREREHTAWERRDSDQKALVEGVDQVIALFSAELQNDENLDQEAGGRIIDLLNNIRAGLLASITEDETAENAAQKTYHDFVAEQTEYLKELGIQVADLQAEIERLTHEIDTDTENIEHETVRRDDAVTTRDSTQKALDDLTELYNHNKEIRAQQLTLISQTKVKLTANEEDAQNWLNNAL